MSEVGGDKKTEVTTVRYGQDVEDLIHMATFMCESKSRRDDAERKLIEKQTELVELQIEELKAKSSATQLKVLAGTQNLLAAQKQELKEVTQRLKIVEDRAFRDDKTRPVSRAQRNHPPGKSEVQQVAPETQSAKGPPQGDSDHRIAAHSNRKEVVVCSPGKSQSTQVKDQQASLKASAEKPVESSSNAG